MRVIPCCPLPYSDGRFNELFAVRTICGPYHRRPRRLAEGLKRAESGRFLIEGSDPSDPIHYWGPWGEPKCCLVDAGQCTKEIRD